MRLHDFEIPLVAIQVHGNTGYLYIGLDASLLFLSQRKRTQNSTFFLRPLPPPLLPILRAACVIKRDYLDSLPFHWSSSVPKKYKRNIVNGDLHRAKRISSNFLNEKGRIFKKYRLAGFPTAFINSVMRSFDNNDEEPPWLFEENKKLTTRIQIPFFPKNERSVYKIKSRIEMFTNGQVKLEVTWKTRKL